MDKGGLNLKLVADANLSHPSIELDGRLSLRPGEQSFAGAAKFESGAAPLWRAAGQLTLDAESAALTELELHVGEEAHELAAKGVASLDFSAAPKASATLASDALDLDAWRASDADAGAGLASMLPAGLPPLPLTLGYAAKTLTFGGAVFTDVSTDLVFGQRQAAPQAPQANLPAPTAWLRFEAHGPGRSRLFLDGRWKLAAEPGFDGAVQASADDARWLKDWLAPLAPQWAPQQVSFHAIDLSARTSMAATAIKLRDLVAEIDGSHVSGTLDYRLGSASQPGRIDADLATPALDLGEAADFDPRSLVSRIFGANDGSLRLDANALTLGQGDGQASDQQGSGQTDARPASLGGLNVDLVKTGDRIDLNELTFEGLDGAVVTASGGLSQQSAHLDARIVGPRASELATLIGRLAPGQTADLVRSRAGLLTPIDLTLSADAAEKDAAFAITGLTAKGSAGATAMEATVKQDQAGAVTISALAQARDSLPLLRLLGLAPVSGAPPGAAQIEIKAHGPLGGAAQTTIKASLGAASLSFQGEATTDLTAPAARGALRFSSPDAAPMLRMAGLVHSDFAAKLPVAAAGDLVWTKAGFGLANLKADVAGASLAGALDYGKEAPRRLTGSLAFDQMPALALFGLALGPPQPAKAGSLWSNLAFAPAAVELPDARIALTVKDMALPAPLFPAGAAAKDARATLATGPGRIDLEGLNCDIAGGRLAGDLKLRRSGGDVSIESHLDFADMALDGPAARGRISGAVDLAGAGKSADALAASLAGSGRALISDLTIPRADPAAVARVFAAFDQDDHKLGAEDVAAALAGELKRADFRLDSGAFDIAIAAGIVHLTPSAQAQKPAQNLSASFDLRRAVLTQRLDLPLSPPPKGFSGPAPLIALTFEGPLSAPAEKIDAAALANALAARAIERESARIEAYEFDAHERAFFYQRLSSERRREAERLKAEAEAQAAAAAAAQKAPNSAD